MAFVIVRANKLKCVCVCVSEYVRGARFSCNEVANKIICMLCNCPTSH